MNENDEGKTKIKFILAVTDAILIFALIVFGMLWYQVKRDLDMRNAEVQKLQQQLTDLLEEQNESEKSNNRLTKQDIIYFSNPLFEGWGEEQMRIHCIELGGTFNPCGSACPDPPLPNAGICIEVCAPRCEFNREKNTKGEIEVLDKSTCEVKGGTWGQLGLLPMEQCNLPTGDARRPCSDGDECESACITDNSVLPETPAKGTCYEWTNVLGTCLNYVEDGRVQGALCVD